VIFVADGQAYEVTEGDYPSVEATPKPDLTPNPDVTPNPEATPKPDVTPNPDLVLPALVHDDGGDNWALTAALIAVGGFVLAAGGLVVWGRVRRARGGSQG
jgi:hypothetical protein